MQKRLEIVKELNDKMIDNFTEINNLIPRIYDILPTAKEQEVTHKTFENKIYTMYDILIEYAIKVMDLKDDKFTTEWLNSNLSDDNSYILADEVPADEEPIIVPIYERDSYIQEEYVDTILTLQELVLSKSNFETLFDFYTKDIDNIIGCAKILMYHYEDLKDIKLLSERDSDPSNNTGLDRLKEIISELKEK